jgi:hypothetical protein
MQPDVHIWHYINKKNSIIITVKVLHFEKFNVRCFRKPCLMCGHTIIAA